MSRLRQCTRPDLAVTALSNIYGHGGVKTVSEIVLELEQFGWDAESVMGMAVAHRMLQHRSAGIAFSATGDQYAPASTEDATTILSEAEALVNGGERQRQYGHPAKNFKDVAAMWAVILGAPVTARQVALCMAALKLARFSNGDGTRDSLVDACGYLRTIEMADL